MDDDLLIKNTLVVKMADMHSGGSTALFPDTIRYFLNQRNHTPSKNQMGIFQHFEKCARLVSVLRKKKRLIIVHNGDAIDGVHHHSPQVVTTNKNEQIDLHVELMKHFMKLAKFNSGDRIYYTKGTEVHTEDNEDLIGKKLGAVMNGDLYAFDELHLNINGKVFWFAHKGPSAGKGANEGNALHNFIRDIWIDHKTNGIKPPDVAVFSHVHTPRWRMFSKIIKGKIVKMEGWIIPSWQRKTRYAHGIAAMQVNSIGMGFSEVTKKGDIVNQDFCIM